MTTLKQPKVCYCDYMPGLHNYGNQCEELVEFIPSKDDIESQKNCSHEEIFEGVCYECGKMINSEEAAKWSKK